MQLDDGGDRVGGEQHADLRIGLVDLGKARRVRQRDRLIGVDVGALDHRGVGADDDRGREPAHPRLRREELLEALALAVEQRLGARHVERHRHDVAADHAGLVLQIGVGDDQRVLDDRPRAGREQPVEAAIEGDAGDQRDKNGRNGGDHREQRDDADVQPRRGPAAAARLHHQPDLAADDAEQQEHRQRVGEQQRDHDRVGRRDRCEIGQHHEGRKG